MDIKFIEEQYNIINESFESNIIVSACAGSGKTAVLVERVLRHSETLEKSHKTIAVLSYTNNSSTEIKERLNKKNLNNIFITTFHGFFYNHILVFSDEVNFSKYLVEDTLKINYTIKCNNFIDWKKMLIEKKTICSSTDCKLDYTLEYCLEILKENESCREYLKARFNTIYIDEVQDNSEIQYEILEELLDIGIKLFLVGDYNQTIYSFRGANPEKFKKLIENEQQKYIVKKLTTNHRCHEYINDFANGKKIENDGEYGVFYGEISDETMMKIKDEKIVCLARNTATAKELEKIDFVYMKKIDYECDNSYMAKKILKEYFTTKNVMLFIREIDIYEEIGKKEIEKIRNFFENGKIEILREINAHIFNSKEKLFLSDKDMDLIVRHIETREMEKYYNIENHNHISMTIHGSKGLQFENVILLTSEFMKNFDERLYYVSCTRAKKRLIIFNNIEEIKIFVDKIKNL